MICISCRKFDKSNIITEFVHGPGIDEPIAMIRGGQTYYYHADGLGSIIAITDSAGRVVQRYEYNSFGEITYQLNPNFVQPYTYTGREYDQETGLYYYRARYYDAKIGRFLQQDPILSPMNPISVGISQRINKHLWLLPYFKGSPKLLHSYLYANNNPVNFVDPSGLFSDGIENSDDDGCSGECSNRSCNLSCSIIMGAFAGIVTTPISSYVAGAAAGAVGAASSFYICETFCAHCSNP